MMDSEIEKQHWTPETDDVLADMRTEYANTLDESRRRELERMMDDRNREVHGVATRADLTVVAEDGRGGIVCEIE